MPVSSGSCGAPSFPLSSLLGARATHRHEPEAILRPWQEALATPRGSPGTRAPGRLALRAVPPNSREAALLSCSRSLRGRAPGKLCKRTRHFVAQDRSASLPSPGGREQGGVHSCMALSYSLAPLLHRQKNKMNARPADLLGSWSRSDVLCKVSMPKRSSMSAACTQKVLHKCLRCSGWVCQQSQLHSRSLD